MRLSSIPASRAATSEHGSNIPAAAATSQQQQQHQAVHD